MNKVVLIGRLTRDPELRYTQSGKAFATFTLAVDRRFRRQAEQNGQPTADFIPCMAWDKLAEIIGNNLAKGRRIGVEGRLQTRTYATARASAPRLHRHSRHRAEMISARISLTRKSRFKEGKNR